MQDWTTNLERTGKLAVARIDFIFEINEIITINNKKIQVNIVVKGY